jgi:hypothetical protein
MKCEICDSEGAKCYESRDENLDSEVYVLCDRCKSEWEGE